MKTALVTGAARGIGRAIATDLARDHALALTWHNHPADAVMADIPDALAVQSDLTQHGSAQKVIDAIIDRFGQLDVIVNNAGFVKPTPLDSVDLNTHHAIFDVNVSAPAALLAAALPHLKEGAAIVNISSVNADLQPMGAIMYGASKAALNTWTRGMAKELGPRGIRVNGVAPGAVNTPEKPRPDDLTKTFEDLNALGRLPTPTDIAAAVRFLASDDARSITGQTLRVCAGYRL